MYVKAKGFTDGCLGGAVRFESRADAQMAFHCCCVDCRKSSGTGHCTHADLPEDAIEVTGEVTFYARPADSGNVVTRGFCGTCGSPVYSKNSGYPGMVFPRASVLDDPEAIRPQNVFYAARAVSWDSFDRALPGLENGAA